MPPLTQLQKTLSRTWSFHRNWRLPAPIQFEVYLYCIPWDFLTHSQMCQALTMTISITWLRRKTCRIQSQRNSAVRARSGVRKYQVSVARAA